MLKYVSLSIICILILSNNLGAQNVNDEKITIAVLELSPKSIDAEDAQLITDRVRALLVESKKYRVLTRDNMEDIFKEQEFQIAMCEKGECVVEAGKILGVQKMVSGSVGIIGDSYTIQLFILNVENGVIENSAYQDYQGKLEQFISLGVNKAVENLINQKISIPLNDEKFKLMQQAENIATKQHSGKRGIHAALMSAAIPGLGEVYAKSYWRAAIFFALDAALLSSYFVYDGKGEDEDIKMKAFGDKYWLEERYWSKIYDLALSAQIWEGDLLETDGRIILDNELKDPSVMVQLRELENATEIGYTHTLPTTNTQQYYEMIYKYLHQFGVGWDDITELTNGDEDAAWIFYDSHANLGTVTPNIKKYRAMRNRSNDYYKTATTMLNLMLLNHVLSAFDAALAVKQFNKKVTYAVRVNRQFDGIDQVTTYGLNVSW